MKRKLIRRNAKLLKHIMKNYSFYSYTKGVECVNRIERQQRKLTSWRSEEIYHISTSYDSGTVGHPAGTVIRFDRHCTSPIKASDIQYRPVRKVSIGVGGTVYTDNVREFIHGMYKVRTDLLVTVK